MYTPVPLLVLLALLAAAFGLVPSPQAQAVVHTLLVATLAASVLHLQARAGARVAMLVVPGVLLACATLLSFFPRFSQATPVLFLACIVATLGTTACLFFRRCSPAELPPTPPSPASSSFEKPLFLSPRRPSLPLALLLCAQLSYTLATAFCIPPALQSSGPAPALVVSLVSVPHLSATHVFRILDTAFTVLAILFVCAAYYLPSRVPRATPCPRAPILSKPPVSNAPAPSSATPTPTTPPQPAPLPLPPPPGTRVSPGPAPRSPVLVTSPPLVYKRAWSWHTPTPAPNPSPDDDTSGHGHEEGDFRDLRDPFAPVSVPVSVPPSAYNRWAAPCASAIGAGGPASASISTSRRPRSSSYDSCVPVSAQTRMSAWGRLPLPLPRPIPLSSPLPSSSPSSSASSSTSASTSHKVHFDCDQRSTQPARLSAVAMSSVRPRPRPRTPPPLLLPRRTSRGDACWFSAREKEKDRDRVESPVESAHVKEDALIAQRLLVRLARAAEV